MRRALLAAGLAGATLIVVAVAAIPASAQAVLAPELKAAYLFNFARFVEWPADLMPAGAPLALCVANDNAVADALDGTVRGRSVEGHGLIVRRPKIGAPLPECQVLYLGGGDLKRALEVMTTVKGPGVFTVSDAEHFADTGGIAELFLDGGRLRIAVNLDALQRTRVKLSSRVLGLARIVRAPSLVKGKE